MSTNDTDKLPFVKMAPKQTSQTPSSSSRYVNKRTERIAQNFIPRFRLSVSEHSCRYYKEYS